MKRTLILWSVVAGLALMGCSKSNEGGGGGGQQGGGTGSGSGNLALTAVVSKSLSYAELKDTLGNPISGAEVRINNTLLSPLGPGFYMSTSVVYQKGTTYTLTVDAGEYGSAEATVTAPDVEAVEITAPENGAHFDKNSEISVSWTYGGGSNDGLVGLTFDYTSPQDTTTYESGILDGSTTSHTIPSSATFLDGHAVIDVIAGDYAVIEGLADPDPSDDFEGSIFGVFTDDTVGVNIGTGEGGTEGQWAGTLTGTVDGSNAAGGWAYPYEGIPGVNVAFFVYAGSDTLALGGNTSTWPPQGVQLMSMDFQTTMTITGQLVGADSVTGTWEMSGAHSGSGTWGGRRVAR